MKTQDNGSARATFASAFYSSLRKDLISGRHAPGERLRLNAICEAYNVGLSPAREALNRLAVEGFVTQSDHRGFSVAHVSREDLMDLTRIRLTLNETALRDSIEHGDEIWEDSVAIALHRLGRVARFEPAESSNPNPEWNRRHKIFHASLLAASPSVRLRQYCDQLFDQAYRYRSLAAVINPEATIARTAGEHKEIAEATLARDADRAARLLREHFERTLKRLLANWEMAAGRLGLSSRCE
jgi:GntR family carbon starvation induced transcriptional regulator